MMYHALVETHFRCVECDVKIKGFKTGPLAASDNRGVHRNLNQLSNLE